MPRSGPFGRVATPIKSVIQAEDFDVGGEGVSYHDQDVADLGGLYRPRDGVDIETTKDRGGKYDVGLTHAGERLIYTVNVPKAMTLEFDARVANVDAGAKFHLAIDGKNVSREMQMPDTGGIIPA